MNEIQINFDGGCRPTNPGKKYGSFDVVLNGCQVVKVSRMELGYGTNNEAEFETLIEALRWVTRQLSVGGFDPRGYVISMFTDSTIVANRINVKNTSLKGQPAKRMAALTKTCLSYLVMFDDWTIEWNPRESNVERFGH